MRGKGLRSKGASAIVGVLGLLLIAPGSAGAANFVVNSLNDSPADGCTTAPGGCTLRDAITDANVSGQSDDITFSVAGSIPLTSTLPTITTAMTITGPGPGASALAVRGNAMNGSIFAVNVGAGVTARIERIEIADARATSFAGGGLGKSGPGTLVLDSVRLFDNDAGQGGALFVGDGLTSIRNSTLESNRAESFGGAINAPEAFGVSPAVELVNSTISGNSAKEFGGGISVALDASMTIRSSTIVANTANSDNNSSGNGGGIFRNASAATVTIANTILAANGVGAGAPSSDGQCAGNFSSVGHNLRSAADANCTGFTGTGDVVDADPRLGTLSSNGGPTQTVPLLTGSPAIDVGDPGEPGTPDPSCPATDQRGLTRGGGAGRCDMGAFELQPPPDPPLGEPPPGEPPQNDFTFGKAKKNKRTGTAKLTVVVPGPGALVLARTPRVKGAEARAAAGGDVKLLVKARGRARTKLSKTGRAKIKALVTYTPDGGSPNSESKKLKLVKR